MFPEFENYEDFRDGSLRFLAEATSLTPSRVSRRSTRRARLVPLGFATDSDTYRTD